MFKIDSENQIIYLTRGDSADIIFSARTDNGTGEQFHPTKYDKLTFCVAKKLEEEPLIQIVNEMDNDEMSFWSVSIEPHHTENLKPAKYNFDVQVEIRDSTTGELVGVKTIIGKTDDITPYFILWGDISPQGE